MDTKLPKIIRLAHSLENNDTTTLFVELVSLMKEVSDLQNALRKIQLIKGDKGDEGISGTTPKRGSDYFTLDDINYFKKSVTPIIGKDYFTEEQIQTILALSTPTKGKDYFTKNDIKEIATTVVSTIGKPKDGKDGSPDTALQIVNKINTLKGIINASAIDGLLTLEEVMKELKNPKSKFNLKEILNQPEKGALDQRWHGGGLTNVIHDNTLTGLGTNLSPLSVVPTGGGFTILTATGARNQFNTKFTFTTTVQPSFIVSDGAWYTALDDNGGIQWTWNSILMQVTMIAPPTNSLFGIK